MTSIVRAQDSADQTVTAQAAPASGAATALTPEEEAARRKALVKESQNPVGNIGAVPFQFNWNNGVGPQSGQQFNLNIQPVVPIVLTPQLTLIARTIFPVIDNPSPALPAICTASPFGCGSTFGIGDVTEQLFVAPKASRTVSFGASGRSCIFLPAHPQRSVRASTLPDRRLLRS